MPTYSIKKRNSMVCEVEVQLLKGEKSFNVAFMPDAHWDNPKCDRKTLKNHLELAKKTETLIILPGDTFCMMQGKYDPRRNKSDILPEHNKVNYIDAVINDAVDWFEPYKENMIIGTGNHESAILKNLETDILERFAGGLKGVVTMGYHFWVHVKVYKYGLQKTSLTIYCHHGSGGGGAVTRGQINMSRQMMHIEGADIISNGHIHEKSNTEVLAHYFDNNGQSMKAKARSIILLQSSTYKQEYTQGGYHIEKGRPPKPLGGNFVTCHVEGGHSGIYTIVKEPRFFSTKTFEI